LRDNILRDAHMEGDSVEVMITAEVDESDIAYGTNHPPHLDRN
jgi:hypothetical protein